MVNSASMRASIALIAWMGISLGAGFLTREGISRTFGPDSWWMVAGWCGLIIGLIHFLVLLIMARQPQGGGT
jgi:hypothetical protein